MSAVLSQNLAMLFTSLFLILNDPPATRADEAADSIQLLSSRAEIQGKVYGIMDRCHNYKDHSLKLRTLVKGLEAENTPKRAIDVVKISYLNGIKYASHVGCQYSRALLKDLQEQYRTLAPEDLAAVVADMQR